MIKEPFMAKAWCSKVLPKIKKGKKKNVWHEWEGQSNSPWIGP